MAQQAQLDRHTGAGQGCLQLDRHLAPQLDRNPGAGQRRLQRGRSAKYRVDRNARPGQRRMQLKGDALRPATAAVIVKNEFHRQAGGHRRIEEQLY